MRTAILSSVVLVVSLASSGQSSVVQKLGQDIKGKVKDGVYTSVNRDYSVHVPELVYPGAFVRDEGGDGVSQVIFTDDFGAFYRIVMLDKAELGIGLDDSLVVFKHLREKEVVQTARGKEWRLIDVEPEGAELSIKTLQPDASWKERRPDLVIAAAVFEHSGHVYHVIAGTSVLGLKPFVQTEESATTISKQRLDTFLAGLSLNTKAK